MNQQDLQLINARIDAAAERTFTRCAEEIQKLPANCPIARELKGFKLAMGAIAAVVAAVVSIVGLLINSR